MPSDDDTESIGYADAVAELEAILAEIEDDSVDIDTLATKVRRAAELIRLCRSRISGARLEIEQIVTDLDEVEPAGDDDVADERADEDEDDISDSVDSFEEPSVSGIGGESE